MNNKGVDECGTGILRLAESNSVMVGLVAMESVNGVLVTPPPRFSRVGVGRYTSRSKPLDLDQPALRVRPDTGPRINELSASISPSTAQTWTPSGRLAESIRWSDGHYIPSWKANPLVIMLPRLGSSLEAATNTA